MANNQTTSRITRSARGEAIKEGTVIIAPPSSTTTVPPAAPADDLEGTDDPNNDQLDGETIEEERRDAIARSMDSYTGEDEVEGDEVEDQESQEEDSEDDTYNAEHDYGSPDSSSSGDSSDSSDSESSARAEDSSEEDSLSSDSSNDSSDSDDSELTVKEKKKRSNMSIKAIDKVIAKALKAKEKAKALLAKEKAPSRDRKAVTKHGKQVSSSKTKSSASRKSIKKENGIRFQEGAPCKSSLPTLQPYWGEAMKNLSDNVPLTVLNPTFVQKDKVKSRKNQPATSSSKNTRNRGLTPPSEYAMTFGEWVDGITLLRKYLKKVYHFSILSDQLRGHVKHVKDIKGKGVPVPDASIYVESIERAAKEKATRHGELSSGNENPYAKGARFEHRDPITGVWEESTTTLSKKRKRSLTRPNLSSNHRRATRLPRAPRLPDIIEMLPPLRRDQASEVRQPSNRGTVRRGRGGASNGRGRTRQHALTPCSTWSYLPPYCPYRSSSNMSESCESVV
ncbi:uncharacterized protein MELLADRAFT_101375 [Melampsora larici-populina 98AG31]|uniref:Uncharacterized protein n=1 Tax=Melampsora larici-populina (strain 98AG31 / pathotype 3-4-7) TaxID=747676 RepID=F4R4J2_MELLP|nr:uncharacterized protein MELLADRAFT_101375 [Melampsora larici-populina 98AG31]EGG12992.1 hypothetical protein MELLADRAFT_101375 [Melampsora larici-populina 98AG31]